MLTVSSDYLVFFLLCIPLSTPVLARYPVVTQITPPLNLAEGPVWDEIQQVLYYIDQVGGTLHRMDPRTGKEDVIYFGRHIGFLVQLRGSNNQLIIGLDNDLVFLSWNYNERRQPYTTCHITSVDRYSPGTTWNDGKADAFGRIWAGTLGPRAENGSEIYNKASFYRVDTTQPGPITADVVLRPVSISNGLSWSADNTKLYYIDSYTYGVDVFDFDLKRGVAYNRRTIFRFADFSIQGDPDGMAIDSEGNLWVAANGGGKVLKINPNTGQLLQTVVIPNVTYITSVAWGGPRLDILYVTTARSRSLMPNPSEPQAGAVFQVTGLGVTGTLTHRAVFHPNCRPEVF